MMNISDLSSLYDATDNVETTVSKKWYHPYLDLTDMLNG